MRKSTGHERIKKIKKLKKNHTYYVTGSGDVIIPVKFAGLVKDKILTTYYRFELPKSFSPVVGEKSYYNVYAEYDLDAIFLTFQDAKTSLIQLLQTKTQENLAKIIELTLKTEND